MGLLDSGTREGGCLRPARLKIGVASNYTGEKARTTNPGLFFVLSVDILRTWEYLKDNRKDVFNG